MGGRATPTLPGGAATPCGAPFFALRRAFGVRLYEGSKTFGS